MPKNDSIQEWLPDKEVLRPFYKGIDVFLQEHLIGSEKHENSRETEHGKVFADPLLGYVNLHAWETRIIDTKLFQRLRGIHQLGLVHLVFPSLNYTRFEHTIGVIGRLNQVLNRIIENSNIEGETNRIKTIVDRYLISLRLAAIFHDVGHCIFSHVSERVIALLPGNSNYPKSVDIQNIFTSHFDKDKQIPIAEILSVSFLGSTQTQQFIQGLDIQGMNKKNITKWLENAARFMLGLPIKQDPESLFLSQLMSSAFDVDKIDYMSREAHYSGIKLEIDIDRILLKLQVFEIEVSQLPAAYHRYKRDFTAGKQFLTLGFSKGGQFSFEEYCVARLALYVKIYLHQKVRAAEAQLTKQLHKLSTNHGFECVHRWLSLSESIIEEEKKERDLFSASASIDFSQLELTNIRDRVLLERAFAFGPMNCLSDPISTNEVTSKKPVDDFFKSIHEDNIRDAIVTKYEEISNILEIDRSLEVKGQIIVDFPRYLNIQQGYDSLYFDKPPLLPLKWTIPIDQIMHYYQSGRALGYVFAPRNICSEILLASEVAIFDATSSIFLQESAISNGIVNAAMEKKQALAEKGFYSSRPYLRPISSYLKSAAAAEMLQKIAANLSDFKSYRNTGISISSITSFVNQFPIDLHDVSLKFLSFLKMYDTSYLVNIIRDTITIQNVHSSRIAVCPLGGILDSATHLSYAMRDIKNQDGIICDYINDTVILDSDRILLFDDNINTGKQVLNILANLLGKLEQLPAKLRLDEYHGSALHTEEAKLKLMSIPLSFVFSVGIENADKRTTELLANHLGFKPEFLSFHIASILKEDEKIFSGPKSTFQDDKKKVLHDYLAEKGTVLMLAEEKTSDEANRKSMGYGNSEAMVIFPYNVPTMTITALWNANNKANSEWLPFAERRRRQNKEGQIIGEDL